MVQPTLTRNAASSRTPGFDVARALAIFGMLLVNFRAMAGPDGPGDGPGPLWMTSAIDLVEGKAAALFVTLAGLGVSLRLRGSVARRRPMREERRALLRRAGVLFGLGLLNLHLWEWDILHCYGVYLLLAVCIMDARNSVLLAVAGIVVVVAARMQIAFNYDAIYDFWEGDGALADICFNGLFPVFPWFAFVVLGIWLGRQDLRNPRLRLRLALYSLAIMIVAETITPFAIARIEAHGSSFTYWSWLSSWPRPPGPAFVASGCACAVLAIVGCVHLTERRVDGFWVLALTATGQLALTIYVSHAVAILVPLEHGFFVDGKLTPIVGYAVIFYVAAVWFSLTWRRQHRYGPLELIVRQLAARSRPGPWGGDTMRTLAEDSTDQPDTGAHRSVVRLL